MPFIRIHRLSKTFHGMRYALNDVSLDIQAGEMVALIGASGSGKSTLLRHLAGLAVADRSTPGVIEVGGSVVQQEGKLAPDIRALRARIGFVFQQFNLVPRLPVIMNVMAGMLYRTPLRRSVLRQFTASEMREGMDALSRVGIAEQAWQRASTLSGGQQQRAAIARTLVQKAQVVLADEPIASLDPESSRRVMEILAAINREQRNTVIVSLHQVQTALACCPRVIALGKGRIAYDGPSAALTAKELRQIYGAETRELGLSPEAADAEGRFPRERAHAPAALAAASV